MAACIAACAAKEFVSGVWDWRGESVRRWSGDEKALGVVALLARGEGIGRKEQGRIIVQYSGGKFAARERRISGIGRARMHLNELGSEVKRERTGKLWSPSPDAIEASDSSEPENGAPLVADNTSTELATNRSIENISYKVSSSDAGGWSNSEAAVFWNESTLSNESRGGFGSSNRGAHGYSRAPTNGAPHATVDAMEDVRAMSKVKMIEEEDPWFKKAKSSNSKISVTPGGRWNKFKTYFTILRSLEIWGFVITFLFKWWLNNQKFTYKGGMTELKKRQKRKVLARWLKESLLRLGPTFIKIGQQFSTRVDILAKEYVDELAELQDQVPPFSSDTAVWIVEEELGRPVDLIFDQFDRDPIAAASLGQVHRAELRGREVVVKVQRPGLKALFDIDLKNLRAIAQNLQNIDPKSDGAKRDWIAIYDECANVLCEEIDYTKEATNAERFALNFRDIPYVKVPRIYRELSTRQVLVMEYVPGIKINRIAALDELGVDRKRLAKYAVESYLEQILRHGFFHADPHPGNIAVDDINGGRLIFYDFGMMGSISSDIRGGLLEVFYGVYEKDPDKVLAAMVQMGVLVSSGDLTAVRRTVQFFLNSFEERLAAQGAEKERLKAVSSKPGSKKRLTEEKSEKKKMQLAAIGEDLLSVGADQPFRFPATFTFVVRAFSVLDGIGKGLDPCFDISEIAKPYALEILRFREAGMELIFKDLRKRWDRQSQAFANIFKQADRVEKISSIIERLEQGDLKLRVRVLESERAFKRVALMQQTIGQAILAATCLQLATMLHLSTVGMPATVAFMASALFGLQALIGILKVKRLDKQEKFVFGAA